MGKPILSQFISLLIRLSFLLHPALLFSQTNLPGVPYDRRFEPWRNTAGTTVYSIIRAAESLPDIVGKYGIVTNTVRRFERQGVALEKGASTTAWQTARGQSEERTTGSELDKNPGWSKGETGGGDGAWQAWWWQRGSVVDGQSSTSRVVVTSTGGSGEIVRVMVGTLGDYAPVTNFSVDASRMGWGDPGAGGTTKEYRVETEVYYRLAQGNFIVVNDGDSDNDGIRDYDDGYNKDGIVNTADDKSSAVVFEELQVMLPPVDVRASGSVWVRLEYDETVLRAWLKDGYKPRDGTPVAEGGDAVKPGVYRASQLGFSTTNFLGRLYIEGLAAGENATVNVFFSEDGIAWTPMDRWKGAVLNVALVPDFNHDRKIDHTDHARVATNETFHFWINDDHEISDADGEDWPGSSNPDWDDDQANGVRDLVDFFPVYLDIGKAAQCCPTNEYKYVIKQANGALNGVPTTLKADSASEDCKPEAYQTQVGVAQAMTNAQLKRITATGVEITGDGMANARTSGEGFVMLFEGRSATTNPLVLEIRRRTDDQLIATAEMPLRLSSVENMYRHINLRPSGGLATAANEPSNYPNTLCNNTNVFFIHGFNVDGGSARGWHAEMFKRLYWSGSKAKFWGVTWEGDIGLINGLNYQENVANALIVSSNFYAQVQGITGDKIILAHSLGNMVVSGAIQDYGLSVSKYFMLNAAVAMECYDPSVFNDTTNDNYMLHEDWVGYSNKTWCSTWFRLFSSPDDRAKLTWKNRFPSIASVAYNFYSSGDEIFEVYQETPTPFSGGLFHLERRAWQKQEMFKGCGGLGGTDWAGWGFSGEYTMTEANAATEDNLRTNAVFRQEPTTMFFSNITAQVQNDIIAQGISALSYAAGITNVFLPGLNKNFDANSQDHKPNGWGRSGYPYFDRWLHSDLKNMAYLYTYNLFSEITSRGGLQ